MIPTNITLPIAKSIQIIVFVLGLLIGRFQIELLIRYFLGRLHCYVLIYGLHMPSVTLSPKAFLSLCRSSHHFLSILVAPPQTCRTCAVHLTIIRFNNSSFYFYPKTKQVFSHTLLSLLPHCNMSGTFASSDVLSWDNTLLIFKEQAPCSTE